MKNKFFLTTTLAIVLFGSHSIFGQTVTQVTGRVVDDLGKPLANARVSLDYGPCRGCTDHTVESLVTSESGTFHYGLRKLELHSRPRLVIEESPPIGYFAVIYDPITNLSYLSHFYGLELQGMSNSMIDLGDVLPVISYGRIDLDLLALKANKIQDRIIVTVSDPSGKILTSRRRVPKEFWDGTGLHLALPKDRWLLEISSEIKEAPVLNLLVDLACGEKEKAKITVVEKRIARSNSK